MTKVFSYGCEGWKEIENPISENVALWNASDKHGLGFSRHPSFELTAQNQKNDSDTWVRVFTEAAMLSGEKVIAPIGDQKILVEVRLGMLIYYVFPDDFPALLDLLNQLLPLVESKRAQVLQKPIEDKPVKGKK